MEWVNGMIPYIVYSNSSYSDVLNIQTNFITKNKDCILFIDNNKLDLTDIYSKYKHVIFYDNNLPYASRVLSCLNQINYEYFVFIHDNDILLDVNFNVLDKLLKFTIKNNYDRIDLRFPDTLDSSLIIKIDDIDYDNWKSINKNEINTGYFLVKNEIPSNYIYNVNPSIWKKTSLLELMNVFKDKDYRSIESMDVQYFCTKYNIFRVHSNIRLKCGYYDCLDIFKYLHITHGGKYLPLNDSCVTSYGQSYQDVALEYKEIINKFNLTQSEKWIK